MAYRLKINEKNIDRVVAEIDNMAKTLSKTILKRWKENIIEFDSIDTEEYYDSISIKKIKDCKWKIFSDVNHSIYVEYGTGPAIGHPEYTHPYDKILKWVISKFGYSDDKAKMVTWKIIQK